jgi:dipeptide/tripeptide permease
MDPLVLALVLLAALLHAVWNSLVKTGGDQLVTAALMGVGSALCGLALLPFAGLPPELLSKVGDADFRRRVRSAFLRP